MRRGWRISDTFFSTYFIYYCGYCIFSSYLVLFLTELGYRASLCGLISSAAVFANLLMGPVGGYITDTFLTTRRYLICCILIITGLNVFCTFYAKIPAACIPALILAAGFAYPFGQLMDAWVNCSRYLDETIVYSRIRAGGSIGFAVMSSLAGYYFKAFGYRTYFLTQAFFFLLMIPFLIRLPEIPLENKKKDNIQKNLSAWEAFNVAIRSQQFRSGILICTMYWFSHRPIGNFLALIIQDRAGDASAFGNVCAVGAATEFATLFVLGMIQQKREFPLRFSLTAALVTGLARPALILFFSGIWPVFAGQILQSVSFAFYLSGSVECFTRIADPRIRSFSISGGVMFCNVVGMTMANLLGGYFCDLLGTGALPMLSLSITILNLILFTCFSKILFVNYH